MPPHCHLPALAILDADATSDALRDDLAETRRARDMYRLLYLSALDGLSFIATAPERYEQLQRDLRREREDYMAVEMRERGARAATPSSWS